MRLNRGSRRVAALAVVLKTGRPSASVPMGLIGLMFVTTGRSYPFAYITPIDALNSRPSARSYWTLFCHVCPTRKPELTAHGDCWPTVPVETLLGNAGAPTEAPLTVNTGARGDPLNCSACSYPP